MLSDETAYHRYLDGEEDAAALLVERYGDRLTLYINGYLHDIHEAEDLMLEAFSLLFVKARPIRGPGGFRAYLFQTARRRRFYCCCRYFPGSSRPRRICPRGLQRRSF